jgi:hypothetical protein
MADQIQDKRKPTKRRISSILDNNLDDIDPNMTNKESKDSKNQNFAKLRWTGIIDLDTTDID